MTDQDAQQLQVVQESHIAIPSIERIVDMAVNGLDSEHSKRAYRRALADFLEWYAEHGGGLAKATVNDYRAWMVKVGVPESSINQRLTAIRRLAREAADNNLIDDATARSIERVTGIARRGAPAGNWLTKDQAEALLNAPDTTTLRGKRDRALLGVRVGCGLRREEAAKLTFAHIQQREGRWAIVELVGKRNKLRTIPMPAWAKALIELWATAAGLQDGYVFIEVTQTGKLVTGNTTGRAEGSKMRIPKGHTTPQSIMRMVKAYGSQIGQPDLGFDRK
jgi:site-specific recombinase XerD